MSWESPYLLPFPQSGHYGVKVILLQTTIFFVYIPFLFYVALTYLQEKSPIKPGFGLGLMFD